MGLLKVLSLTAFLFGAGACTHSSKNQQADRRSASPPLTVKNRSLILGEPQFSLRQNQNFLDPKQHLAQQWGLKDISALKAWRILEKNIEEQGPPPSIIVAVVDTGIHTLHPCLKNKLWTNPGEIAGNGKDDDNNGFVDDIHGWNFVNNNNDVRDYHGHGTHVSGIIAAQGKTKSSPNCEVAGVNPYNVQIMTLKYFDESAKSQDNIQNTVKSMEYAVKNGAHIINYSGGGPGENQAERTIIATAADKNIILVAALGNEGVKIGKKEKYYPASYEFPNTIFVQSKGEGKGIVHSSNLIQVESLQDQYKKEQTAPGENIISTLPPKSYLQGGLTSKISRGLAAFQNHNRYGYMTGTSQATAFATGVVALVKSIYPDWPMWRVIDQVEKTGFGQGTEKIREATNQGKKLSAHEALIMRDKTVTPTDQIARGDCYDLDNPETRTDECDRGGRGEGLLPLHKLNEEIKAKTGERKPTGRQTP